MKQNFSYHTHTIFSDGKNTVEEMIIQAKQLGWQEMGISDHLIVHKNLKQSYSWEKWKSRPQANIFNNDFLSIKESFIKHTEEIHKFAHKHNIQVKVGAEVDFFLYDGWYEEFVEFYKLVGLDYAISGNHYLPINNGEDILDPKDVEILSEKDLDKALCLHFSAINQAVKSRNFSFIAHPDFIRKTPGYNKENFEKERKDITENMKKLGIGVEISTKGLRKQGYYYPDEEWLNLFIMNNVPIVISDDAHRITELGYGFDDAETYLSERKCKTRWKYKNDL